MLFGVYDNSVDPSMVFQVLINTSQQISIDAGGKTALKR